jgi:hypothetical protein
MEPVGKKMTRAKHVLSDVEGTQSTPSDGQGPPVYPELGRRGRNDKARHFAPWAPFDGVYPELSRRAQDMLGARKFLEVVLSSISSEASKLPPSVRGDPSTSSGLKAQSRVPVLSEAEGSNHERFFTQSGA